MDKQDKSLSETNIPDQLVRTPPTYFVTQRNKRGRELDCEHDFDSFRNEIKAMLVQQQTEISKIHNTLVEIKTTNSNIESSMSFLASQNEELKQKIEQLEVQSKKDRNYITILEDKIEDMQRETRKTNIEIKNVPKNMKETKEDLLNMVLCLSKNTGCNIDRNDIKDIYRIQSKRDINKTPVVAELSSTIKKTELLRMVKQFNIKNREKLCAKHLGFRTEEYSPVYVSEQLTAKAARLYFLARDLSKSKDYKFCWTAFGRIYVRKTDNSPILIIKNESKIQTLMQDK
ncbi:uncharacterized protein LOC123698703 [Colias croceus]|uniref:uncharacterized protein LOC123698703 n=1 Tax=Colias crocea TaxID=72248 RepID=UPI001E27A29A|nr:uncharacterized protein LOC123698703 [Colias croceus]